MALIGICGTFLPGTAAACAHDAGAATCRIPSSQVLLPCVGVLMIVPQWL